jgi:hypothetical protein
MQRRPVHPRRARLPPPPPRHPAPNESPPCDPARVCRRALAYFTPDELADAIAATPWGRQPAQRRVFMRQDSVQLLPVPAAHLPGGQRTPAGRGRRVPHSRHAALPAELPLPGGRASSVGWERREFQLDDDRLAIVSETDAAPAKRRAPRQPGTLVCATPRPLLNAPAGSYGTALSYGSAWAFLSSRRGADRQNAGIDAGQPDAAGSGAQLTGTCASATSGFAMSCRDTPRP